MQPAEAFDRFGGEGGDHDTGKHRRQPNLQDPRPPLTPRIRAEPDDDQRRKQTAMPNAEIMDLPPFKTMWWKGTQIDTGKIQYNLATTTLTLRYLQ